MSKEDFRFIGSPTHTSVNTGPQYWAYRQGIADGGMGTGIEGGYAPMMQGVLNSSLSNPLGVGGDYCRAAIFSTNAGSNTGAYQYGWCGLINLATGSGGGDYPVTTSPAAGTLISYSLRSFVRIDGSIGDNPGYVGSWIGVTAKSKTMPAGGDNEETNDDDFYSTLKAAMSGYNVALSTCNHLGLDGITSPTGANTGVTTVPRLVFFSQMMDDTNNTTPGSSTGSVCAGTYAFDTWYHIRMDVIPALGQDTVKVYTADITDTIGSETWTLVNTTVIGGAADYYRPWDDTTNHCVGFSFGSNVGKPATSDLPHDTYIDRWQFFTKDIS